MLTEDLFPPQERMLSQSGLNARSRDMFGLRCLPGKITQIVIEVTVVVIAYCIHVSAR